MNYRKFPQTPKLVFNLSDKEVKAEENDNDEIICPLCSGRGKIKVSKWRAILNALTKTA